MAFWQEEINKEINNCFGKDWYLKTRALFESHSYYDKDSDLIIYPKKYNYKDFETREVTILKIWFGEFCFNGLKQNDKSSLRLMKGFVPRFFMASNFQVMMERNINSKEVIASYRWVKNFIDYLEGAMINLYPSHEDARYVECIEYLCDWLIHILWTANNWIRELYEISNTNTDKLNFMLNQEQLVALLYLIGDSRIIDGIEDNNYKGKREYHTFCSRYFCYLKGNDNDFGSISGLSKRISKVRRGEKMDYLEQVFSFIKQAYDKAGENHLRK